MLGAAVGLAVFYRWFYKRVSDVKESKAAAPGLASVVLGWTIKAGLCGLFIILVPVAWIAGIVQVWDWCNR